VYLAQRERAGPCVELVDGSRLGSERSSTVGSQAVRKVDRPAVRSGTKQPALVVNPLESVRCNFLDDQDDPNDANNNAFLTLTPQPTSSMSASRTWSADGIEALRPTFTGASGSSRLPRDEPPAITLQVE
jgi:hypothetical protein